MTAGLAGKTALITGAGRGIGAAIATGLAQPGAYVILLARTPDQLDETANTIRASASCVQVYRPRAADTAMQGWIRSQGPERTGAGLATDSSAGTAIGQAPSGTSATTPRRRTRHPGGRVLPDTPTSRTTRSHHGRNG